MVQRLFISAPFLMFYPSLAFLQKTTYKNIKPHALNKKTQCLSE